MEDKLLKDFHLVDTDPLWKIIHYKLIEDFRLRLKHKDPVVSSSFRAFLTDSICFYLGLVKKMSIVYDLDIALPFVCYVTELPRVFVPDKLPILLFIHRCFIYLGDLARYLQVHSDKKKQWRLSKLYYQLALKLFPNLGNPYNQLAVIHTHENNHISAVYMYFRSLVVQSPFPTALDNLIIIFTRFKNSTLSPDLNLSDSFLYLFCLILTKKPNAASFAEFYPMFLQTLESNLVDRSQLDFGLLLQILMIILSALHVYKDKDSFLANLLGRFVYASFQIILTRLNQNIIQQLENSRTFSEIDNFDQRFLFCEPYFPILKLILIFLSKNLTLECEEYLNVKRLAASCCTLLVKFRIKHFSYRTEITDTCFPEDLEWNGFLPLECSFGYHKGDVLLGDDAKCGPLDQIKHIATQMSQITPPIFFVNQPKVSYSLDLEFSSVKILQEKETIDFLLSMVEYPALDIRSSRMIFDDSMWMPSSVAPIEIAETESATFDASAATETKPVEHQDQVGTLAFLGLESSQVEGLEREFQKDLTVSLDEKVTAISKEYVQNTSSLQNSLNWLNILPWDQEQPDGG